MAFLNQKYGVLFLLPQNRSLFRVRNSKRINVGISAYSGILATSDGSYKEKANQTLALLV